MSNRRLVLIGILLVGVFLTVSCSKKQQDVSPVSKEKEKQAPVLADKSGIHIQKASIVIDGKPQDWQAAGITGLTGLEWKPELEGFDDFVSSKRIKSVYLACDASNLFILFEIYPGVAERFQKRHTSGSVGVIYLDIDASKSTGCRRNIKDGYSGWDYRIYLSEGFMGKPGASLKEVEPIASYSIEKIKNFIQKDTGHGPAFNCEYEDVKGGEKFSFRRPADIAFEGAFLEIRFPFSLFTMNKPAQIHMVIEDLGSFPNAEAEITARLE